MGNLLLTIYYTLWDLNESIWTLVHRSMGFDITLPKGMKVFKNVSGEKDRTNFCDGIHNQIRQRWEEILGTK